MLPPPDDGETEAQKSLVPGWRSSWSGTELDPNLDHPCSPPVSSELSPTTSPAQQGEE